MQVQGDLLVLAAGQGRQMGRSLNVCPEALLDDGALDVMLVWGSPGEQVGGGRWCGSDGRLHWHAVPCTGTAALVAVLPVCRTIVLRWCQEAPYCQ